MNNKYRKPEPKSKLQSVVLINQIEQIENILVVKLQNTVSSEIKFRPNTQCHRGPGERKQNQ